MNFMPRREFHFQHISIALYAKPMSLTVAVLKPLCKNARVQAQIEQALALTMEIDGGQPHDDSQSRQLVVVEGTSEAKCRAAHVTIWYTASCRASLTELSRVCL
jgi:hypothetical protein